MLPLVSSGLYSRPTDTDSRLTDTRNTRDTGTGLWWGRKYLPGPVPVHYPTRNPAGLPDP